MKGQESSLLLESNDVVKRTTLCFSSHTAHTKKQDTQPSVKTTNVHICYVCIVINFLLIDHTEKYPWKRNKHMGFATTLNKISDVCTETQQHKRKKQNVMLPLQITICFDAKHFLQLGAYTRHVISN